MSASARPKIPKGIPSSMKKRRLLNNKELTPADCREYGEKFLSLGWWDDALEFFRRGNVTDGLEKTKAHALATGDAFLLSRLGPQPPEVWQQLAEKALALEKFYFARKGFEMAGEPEKAAQASQLIVGLSTLTPDYGGC